MDIHGHDMGSVGVRRSKISQPYIYYQSEDRLAEMGSRKLM